MGHRGARHPLQVALHPQLWDRYSKEVVAIENKPSTVAEKTRMWFARIEPAIGKLKISDVTEEDAGAVVRAPLRLDVHISRRANVKLCAVGPRIGCVARKSASGTTSSGDLNHSCLSASFWS